MIIMCNIFGLLPIKLKKHSNQFHTTPCGILSVFFNATIFIGSFGLSVTMQSYVTWYFDTSISYISSFAYLSTHAIAMIAIYLWVLFNRKLLMQTIDEMHVVDDKLRSINEEVNYTKLLWQSVKLMMINKVKFCIYTCCNVLFQVYTKHDQAVTSFISYFYPHLIFSIIVVKYASVMDNIFERIHQLNKVKLFKIFQKKLFCEKRHD